jgi:hypothetical protein
MFAPSVATELPPGFIESSAEVVQPPIGAHGSGSGSVFTQWHAWRSPTRTPTERGDTLLLACVATPIPGWVDDMRPSVDARTVSLMNASVERVVGVPIETREGGAGDFLLRPVGAPEGTPWVGIGRTFVGFSEHDVMTCFAACAGAARRGCDASARAARLEGTYPPPPPGVVLGALTWAVHHPTTTVTWGGVLAFALGVVAVASRRRPRSRI